MSDDFGPTCMYRDTESQIFHTAEDLKAAEKKGWKDNPTDGAKVEDKPAKKTYGKKKADK